MRLASRWLLLLVSSALTLSAACEADPTDPIFRRFSGTFVLQTVDGTPVPAVRAEDSRARQSLLADTLWSDGKGNYERATMYALDSIGRPYHLVSRSKSAGTYSIRGDTVDFHFTCPANALCIQPPVGWRETDVDFVVANRGTNGFVYVLRFLKIQ
jgi:hypothetical protein